MAVGGVWLCLINLMVFKLALDAGRGLTEAQGLTFLTLVVTEFVKAYNFRSDRLSVFGIGLFRNKWLNLAIIWEVLLLVLIVYTPFLQESFHTFSLSLSDWAVVILSSLTILPVLEITKAFIRMNAKKQAHS